MTSVFSFCFTFGGRRVSIGVWFAHGNELGGCHELLDASLPAGTHLIDDLACRRCTWDKFVGGRFRCFRVVDQVTCCCQGIHHA